MYLELGWKQLCKRRARQKLLFFYKIVHNIHVAPVYLQDSILPFKTPQHGYNLVIIFVKLITLF